MTHTEHLINVSSGEINVTILSMEFGNSSYFNGIQIVQVPEPASLLAVSIGFLLFHHGRQRRVLAKD